MQNSYLELYAKQIYEIYNLKENRKIGIISNYLEFKIEYLSRIINIDKYNYDIIKKEQSKGYFMKWHFDNAKIIKHKPELINNYIDENNIKISNKHILHYYIKKPIYTLIIYESDYDVDFTGGTLEFIDGTIIKPKKGLYVLFDSNELHKVNIMTSGKRINYLIKFYEK